MKIEQVNIEGFGLFNKPRRFNFINDKLNLIYGNNETGKTTLLKAIIAGFFGLDKSRWALYKSEKPANNYFIEIKFHDKDVEFNLIRDFESNEVVLSKKDKIMLLKIYLKVKPILNHGVKKKNFIMMF